MFPGVAVAAKAPAFYGTRTAAVSPSLCAPALALPRCLRSSSPRLLRCYESLLLKAAQAALPAHTPRPGTTQCLGQPLLVRQVSSRGRAPLRLLHVPLLPFSSSFSSSSPPFGEAQHLSATSRRPLSASAMASSTEAVVVYVTVPDKAAGQKLASGIIENKLAACVNRVPGVESTYFWEGKVETSAEELLIIKTRHALLDLLSAYVKANHPYELPEFIALPITGGSEAYLKWVMENTRDP